MYLDLCRISDQAKIKKNKLHNPAKLGSLKKGILNSFIQNVRDN